MPPPINIDRDQVRMLVLSVGVRDAARQLNLSENTVKSWSLRGHWLDVCRQQPPPLPPSVRPVAAPNAPTPADALSNTLLDDSNCTKIAMSRAARRGAEHVAGLDRPADILAVSKSLANLARVAAQVHGWGGEQGPVGLNVLSQVNISL